MDATTRASTLFIAVGVLVAGLVWLRDILAPFALAVFFWLIIDGFANALRARMTFLPRAAALFVAVTAVFAAAVSIVAVITDAAADFASRGPAYEARITELLSGFAALFPGQPGEASLTDILESQEIGPFEILNRVRVAVQSVASSALFVCIYVVFLFAAQASFANKMEALFTSDADRERARALIGRVRLSVERYLWVQTQVSVLTALVCYVTLLALGLDNALFWAFLILLFNYIPTIGSIVATFLPAAFALVQYDTLWQPAAVLVGVGFWQALIGNFLQPRMQGQNLNLATIVVLLGLAIWGAIWGIPGMFLSSPLTVLVMAVLAQFASTRWIAVLLSADGRPDADRAPTRT